MANFASNFHSLVTVSDKLSPLVQLGLEDCFQIYNLFIK